MKSVKIIATTAVLLIALSFNAQPAKKLSCTSYKIFEATGLTWKSEEIDLGNIPQGKPVTVQFEFTNTSKQPIVINNVATSCGCTVADYPKKPINAGEKSTITTTYNAAALGVFTKTITVTLENNETKVLRIKGTVVQA